MVNKPLIFILLLFILALAVQAIPTSKETSEQDCIYYFYGEGEGCSGCLQSNDYITSLSVTYPELQINQHEVYYNFDNYQQLESYFTAYHIEDSSRGVPAVFIQGSYFVGAEAITKLLENRILDNEVNQCPSPQDIVVGVVGEKSPHWVLDTLTLPVLTNYAIKDIFKPAGLALVLIMILLFGLMNRPKPFLKIGLAFVCGVYLAYILDSIGLFFRISTGNYFPKLISLLGIVVGTIVVLEFFKGKTIVTINEKYKKLVRPSIIFVLGLVVAMFTLPSLGAKYDVLTNLIALNHSRWFALLSVLYYLFVVILRLVLETFVLYEIFFMIEQRTLKNDNEKNKKMWLKQHFKVLKFCVAVSGILLGLLVLFL